jgi:hypothetical protein
MNEISPTAPTVDAFLAEHGGAEYQEWQRLREQAHVTDSCNDSANLAAIAKARIAHIEKTFESADSSNPAFRRVRILAIHRVISLAVAVQLQSGRRLGDLMKELGSLEGLS